MEDLFFNVTLIVVLTLSLFDSKAYGQSFSQTSKIESAAFGQSATKLDDGRVILIGRSVEIFDPKSQKWTTVSPMNKSRTQHTASKLANGKILVVGGMRESEALKSCELYDVENDSWTIVRPLKTARYEPQTTVLNNGKVLVTGGTEPAFFGMIGSLASAELYDPEANTWTSAGTMSNRRSRHRQVKLDSGEVLVAGGRDWSDRDSDFPFPALSDVDIYNPDTNQWRSGPPMINAHYSGSMIKLKNGDVLMATGGKLRPGTQLNVEDHPQTEVYDFSLDTWRPVGKMKNARRSSRVSMLCDGRVMVNGGYEREKDRISRSAEIYDPALESWTEVGPMPVARSQHTSTLLNNCNVLIAGGIDEELPGLTSVLLFDPFGEKSLPIIPPIFLLLDDENN